MTETQITAKSVSEDIVNILQPGLPFEEYKAKAEGIQVLIDQAIATATQQAVEVGCPWSGSEYAGWMPLEYKFKSKLDAKKWIEQKYLETKKDPDLIGKCSWTDKSKTKFKAKVETRFETECGMEYDETTIYYEIKPMEFEALSQKGTE